MRAALAACLLWLAAGPLCAQVIASAVYTEPTTRYPHGVLGDTEEWGTLSVVVRTERGKEGGLLHSWLDKTYEIRLPEDRVFEDLEPRLVNLDGAEGPEIIAVESHQEFGARLVVFGLDAAGVPVERAATRYIGTRFRWLAPVGVADFDGDGVQEIALVDRPHLARRLIVLDFKEGNMPGEVLPFTLTNHRIGDAYISGGLRDCGTGPQMVLLTPDWDRIVQVAWEGGNFNARDIGPNTGQKAIEAALDCR